MKLKKLLAIMLPVAIIGIGGCSFGGNEKPVFSGEISTLTHEVAQLSDEEIKSKYDGKYIEITDKHYMLVSYGRKPVSMITGYFNHYSCDTSVYFDVPPGDTTFPQVCINEMTSVVDALMFDVVGSKITVRGKVAKMKIEHEKKRRVVFEVLNAKVVDADNSIRYHNASGTFEVDSKGRYTRIK